MLAVIAILLLLKNFNETLFIVNAENIKSKLKNITIVNDSIAVVVVDIVKTCFYRDRITVAGNWTDFDTWHRLLVPHLSINLIALQQSTIFERHKRLKKVFVITEDVVRKLHNPSQLFILSVSTESLNELFERLRDSMMWNSRAMFFLVNENLDKGCFNSIEVLRIAWSYNVLNAVYVCRDSKGKINMFDFNPFANDAEAPWEVVDVAVDEDRGHPFTVNQLSLHSAVNVTPTICEALHHDKTIHLNGYPIRLGTFQMTLMLQLTTATKSHYGLSDFTGRDARIARLLWDKLQAKPTIQLYYNVGGLNVHGKPQGILKDVLEGRVDMILNQYYYNDFWRQLTYPHWSSGLCLITRRSDDHFSIVSRLMLTSKIKVMLTVLATWLTVAVTFKFFMKMSQIEAVIVVLQMLLAIPTTQTHLTVKYRFFVTWIALFMYCLNLHIQSSLTSTFVAHRDVKNIDTVSQLLDSNMLLYGELYNQGHLRDSRLFYRYRNSTVSQCLGWLRNGNGGVACAENCYLATEYFKTMHEYLHVSRESINKVDLTFVVREDWPLLERVDDLVKRFREGGMYKYMRNMEMVGIRGMGRKLQKEKKDGDELNYVSEAKPVNIKVLGFGWYSLGVGFVLSFIVMIVEIVVVKWSKLK